MNSLKKQITSKADISLDITADYPLKKGSYRFLGCSNFRGIGSIAYLHLHGDSQCAVQSVLLSGNGRFFEVFTLSESVSRITLTVKADEHSSDCLQLQTVSLDRISNIKRRAIFHYIAWSVWSRFTKSQRHHHHLFWYTPLLNSRKAYESAQQHRFKYGTINYQEWLASVDHLSSAESNLIKRYSLRIADRFTQRTSVVIDLRNATPLALDSTMESIKTSLLQPSAVLILHTEQQEIHLPTKHALYGSVPLTPVFLSGLSSYIASHCEQKVVWIPAGCLLAPHALTWFNAQCEAMPSLTCIYSDHDLFDPQGLRYSPQFKPDWSDEMAFASGYLGPLLCVNAQSILDTLKHTGNITPYSLMLYSAAQRFSHVYHIPSILWHLPDMKRHEQDLATSAIVLQTFLQQQQRPARVSYDQKSRSLRIHDALPEHRPVVSIIIPSRDRLDLLIPCIESILSLTSYQYYEVLIVDNQSQEPQTLDYFETITNDHRIKVIPFNHPFNYAAINNYAATHAKGSLLCLLNNDTEVTTAEWLAEMISVLHLESVGAVGAQLRYPNGLLQHAGDLIGGSGCANHLHGALEADDLGYMNRVGLRQDLSAVTAACLLTFKDLYQSLGGLEQRRLKVAFNDVDYCLRIREAGLRVIYTPYAQLIHYESESRGADVSTKQYRRSFKEAQYMRKRWSDVMMNDPFYNPNLNYYRCDFSLDPAPVIPKPWD